MLKISLFIIAALMFLCSSALFSQDYIIKSNKDTIFCKILNEGNLELKYILPDSNDQTIKKIKYTEINYYALGKRVANSSVSSESISTNSPDIKMAQKKGSERVFRASFSYGYGKWYYKLPTMSSANERDYYSRLIKGKALELDLTFILDNIVGIGFSYASLSTKSDFQDYFQTQQGINPSLETFYEDVTMSYLGANFFVLIPTRGDFNVILGAGPGRLSLKDELSVDNIYLVGEGSDLAIRFIGYLEYMIADNFSCHISASFVSSKVSSLEVDGSDYDFDNNTRHIKLTAGIALNL